MAPTSACPDLAAYRRLVAGSLSAAERSGLLRHLEGCAACAKKIGALPKEDTLFGVLHDETLAGSPGSAKVARLIQRLRDVTADEKQIAAAPPSAGAPTVDAMTHNHGAGEPSNATLAAAPADRGLYDFLAPPQAADELGRLGSYRVLKVLGAGGMGVVFKAEDPMLQRPVALKAMLPILAVSATARERFLREARSAASIKHDHIVHIYQVGEDRGVPYLAMEFLEGEPLDERLKGSEPLSLAEVLRIGREIADGLEAAHLRGLVHRDIKPANIWLETRSDGRGTRDSSLAPRVKILDFGLARAAGGESHLTQTGAIVGTPAYMAPEQAQGKLLDHRCDLFSLGCVIYRMCTGAAPFKGSDTISTLMAVASHTPQAPQQLRPELPRRLSDLVMALLAKDPAARPATARDVADALAALAQPLTTSPPRAKPVVATAIKSARTGPAPTVRRSTAPERTGHAKTWRSPILWVALAAAGALGVLGIGGCLLAMFLMRLQAGEGIIVLQADDDAQVRVFTGGKQVALLDTKSSPEVKLAAGAYELELVGGKDGLKLQTKHLTLKRGERETARVRFEPHVDAGSKSPTDAFFNDKDLTGWHGLPGRWSVKNGSIVGTPLPGTPFNTFLYSEKTYKDFDLKVQVRRKDGIGNSGVQFRSHVFDPNKFIVTGPQCEIDSANADFPPGSFVSEPNLKPFAVRAPRKPIAQLYKDTGFNDFRIRCVGKQLLITVNGVTAIDGNFPELPDEGVIAWQLFGPRPPTEIIFRNITFIDLSRSQ
jgi:serine/threonine protein kinase